APTESPACRSPARAWPGGARRGGGSEQSSSVVPGPGRLSRLINLPHYTKGRWEGEAGPGPSPQVVGSAPRTGTELVRGADPTTSGRGPGGAVSSATP